MADQLPEMPMPQISPLIASLDPIAAIVRDAEMIAHEVTAWGGGQYAFHPDELQSVIKQWQQLDETVQGAMTHTQQRVRTTTPTTLQPGNENASLTASHAAHNTNQAYQTYLDSMHKYIQGYVTNLQGVLDRYNATESANVGMANRQHGSLA